MKRRKTLLILAIICFAVAGAAGLELGSMVYDCYNPTSGPKNQTLTGSITTDLSSSRGKNP